MTLDRDLKFLLDPYGDWCAAQGIPVYGGYGIDTLTCESAAWPRLGDGCKGAIVDLKGRGDYMGIFVLDLPPAAASSPIIASVSQRFFGQPRLTTNTLSPRNLLSE